MWLQKNQCLWEWCSGLYLCPHKHRNQFLYSTSTSNRTVVSEQLMKQRFFLFVFNTDISQIKYSWQELNWSSWDTTTLIKSIWLFLNAGTSAEEESTDPKWSQFWSLSSWEVRWVNKKWHSTQQSKWTQTFQPHIYKNEGTERTHTHTQKSE